MEEDSGGSIVAAATAAAAAAEEGEGDDEDGGAGGVLRPWSRLDAPVVAAAAGNCGEGTASRLGEVGGGSCTVSIRSWRRRKGGVEKGKEEPLRRDEVV